MFRLSHVVRSCAKPAIQKLAAKQFLKSVTFIHKVRSFSTEAPKAVDDATSGETKTKSEVMKYDSDEYDDYEPQTKQEKVSYYGSILMRLLMVGTGLALAAFTFSELFPGRTSPNSIFSEVFDLLQNNDEVREITGDGMKAFGRDTGYNTEGRRNHIESYKYTADDGSKRTRVKFNIKGNKGQVHVWVEVSKDMQNDEFVYIVCQNARTGRVLTVVDNREMLEAGMIEQKKSEGVMTSITNFFSSSNNGAPKQ